MVVLNDFGVQDLFEAAEVEIINTLYHPFTLSSLSGTLPDSSLLSFLRDEAYVLSAAVSLSNHQQINNLLTKHVNNLHQSIENVIENMDDNSSQSNEFQNETTESAKELRSFMTRQAEEGKLKATVILMALLHIRLFLEKSVCKYLAENKNQNIWITAYGEPDFQACASLVEEDLESELSKSTLKQKLELQHIFKAALRHQIHIFAAAYPGQNDVIKCTTTNPWHPVNLLFATDYDVTCTVKDTSEVLVTIAQRNNRDSSNLEEMYWSLMKVHDNRIKDCLSLWEYGSVARKLTPVAEKRSSLPHLIPGMDLGLRPYIKDLQEQLANPESSCEYELSNLRSILRQLGDLEKRINKEVMAAGVLKGIRREEIRAEVKNIPLHPRCGEFLLQLSATNTPIHYISATWSRDLIIGGLPHLPEGHLFVHSNDLEYDSNEISLGTFRAVVQDAFNKEAILHALRRMYNAYSDEGKRAVFLGDSTNDLLALLDADLGIVMGQNPAFREMLLRYNLQLFPLAVAAAHIRASVECGEPRSYRHSGVLFEASGWAEVEACFLTNN